MRRSRFDRWLRAVPYLLTFFGFALRLYHITYQSFWWDEAYSLHMAQDGLAAMLGLPSSVTDVHWDQPPLHYALLAFWARLAGTSELSLRYLSSFFGVLLLPVVYRVGYSIFHRDRFAALAALAVTAFSPLYVVYSQEVRVYALLPLFYLLLIYTLHRLEESGGHASLRPWVDLAVVEALLLYSHFFAVLGIFYANLFLLALWFLWRRRGFSLRHWIGSQFLAAALFAPWAWKLFLNWDYFRTRGSVRESWVVPPGPLAFARRIWRFIVSGNEAAVEEITLLAVGISILALVAPLAFLFASRIDLRPRRMRSTLFLGLIPLTFCFALWQIWPDAQPRYTLVFSIPLFLVAGRSLSVLLTNYSRTTALFRLVGVLLALTLALTFCVGLYVQYFDERFHKDDVRGVAAYLEKTATIDDVILIGPGDYSVPYYYDGPALVAMARDEPRADRVRQMGELATGKRRFFLVRWAPSKADLHGLRPFLLEQTGRLEEWRDFRGLDVRTYAIDGPIGPLPESSVWNESQTQFGPLTITGIWYEPSVTTDNAVTVALRWRLDELSSSSYKVVVMLTDVEDRRLSSTDVLLLDETGLHTQHWPVGTETVNFYVVSVPVGTPPLPHRLVVGVYDANTLARLSLTDESGKLTMGQDLSLGEVVLTTGRNFDSDPYGTWAGVDWETPQEILMADGLLLEQFAVLPRSVLPGKQVTVLLRWHAEEASRPSVAPQLRLSQNGRVWAKVDGSLLTTAYSPDQWSVNEVIVERREMIYPPRRGIADLTLVTDNRTILLGQMELDEPAMLWEAPSSAQVVGAQFGDWSELLGYELESAQMVAGQPFRLTLYWQALNNAPLETTCTVFAQLLAADGHLIAQHDSPPAENERPTTTWVDGEVIKDTHTLTFHDTTYTGSATLIVGLYDSMTVTRVGTAQGQDHVILSNEIAVNAK
ncbi:MAG: hypothetical protein GY832_14585 [Chloroflexi bacterium]|nr:hypothetical protein [Chloroflexota bacterium]